MSVGRALGKVRVPVDVARAATGETIVASRARRRRPTRAQIHMVVRVEPDRGTSSSSATSPPAAA
ncbi:hypothetical protein E2562_022694 [Oryza meyeriana var. granulata]|uniref:Uncharacterized protein n=1 Tax=Oryza meyeriana var. granulata TaxID=110450 RepID=A0A6G1E085_9ORYZ|nr:hypothetical protein E2562_022694 [Oryza meyeriana var. granulata]